MTDPASEGWPAGKVFEAATQGFTYDDLIFMPGKEGTFATSEVGRVGVGGRAKVGIFFSRISSEKGGIWNINQDFIQWKQSCLRLVMGFLVLQIFFAGDNFLSNETIL